jgi:hypothetical protein
MIRHHPPSRIELWSFLAQLCTVQSLYERRITMDVSFEEKEYLGVIS